MKSKPRRREPLQCVWHMFVLIQPLPVMSPIDSSTWVHGSLFEFSFGRHLQSWQRILFLPQQLLRFSDRTKDKMISGINWLQESSMCLFCSFMKKILMDCQGLITSLLWPYGWHYFGSLSKENLTPLIGMIQEMFFGDLTGLLRCQLHVCNYW